MKRSLQLLIMIVSIIALNSCKDRTPTFTVYEFDNSQTKARSIEENWVYLEFRICQPETGNNRLGYYVYMAIADYPEYFKGEERSNGWSEVQNLGEFYAGNFTTSFSELVPNTTYYYAPYVSSDGSIQHSIILGEVKSFTTPKHIYSKKDYLGTYTMTYRTDENSGVQTWNNVKIGSTTTGEIYLQNLPPYGYTAYAYWGEKDGILLGTSEFYSEDDVSTYDGYKIAPIFTPIYYDVSKNEYYDALIDGYSYVNFVMTEKGVIKMIPTETAGSSGYYSNAFVWIVYRISTWKAIATSAVIYDVTLTKL